MVDARQLDIILKIAADRQAANQASGVFDKLNSDLAAVGKTSDIASQKLANISRNARIDTIGESFGKMARKIKDTDAAAEQLEKRLKQIGATQPEIERATDAFSRTASEGGGAHLSEGLSRAGAKARFLLPAINVGGVSSEAISKVVQVLGALPPVALPVIGVIVALGAGFVALEATLSGVKKQLGDAVNANKSYYELIASGAGVEEGKKRLEELQRTQKAQQEELASLQNATAGGFKAAVAEFGDAGARLLYGLGQVGSADDALAARQDELTKSLSATTGEIDGTTRALNDGTLASNDYRKALEAEAKIKSDAALAGATDTYNQSLKLQQEQLMSSSQLMGKVTDAIQQQNAAQAALNQLQADKARGVGGLDEQIRDFELQLGRTGADITRLYKEFADRKGIEDAIQGEKDLAAARKEVDKVNSEVNKDTQKYNDDITAMADKLRESMTNLRQSFDNANAEAEIDRQNKIADLASDSHDKEIEAESKNNEERLKIEADYQKHVKEIEKEFTRSSAEAIQDRNAVALDAAETKRKDELDDAKTNRDDTLNERDREYKAELKQLENNNANRIAEINRDFQRQAEQRARKYQFDQQQLYESAVRERALRMSAYEKQLADLRTNLQMNSDLWAAAGTTIVNYVKSVKDSINNILGGGQSVVGNGVVSGVSDLPWLGGAGFSAGGTTAAGAGLGVRAPKAPAAGGGIAVSVSGVGMNRNGVIREVTKQLNAGFDEAGF